MAKMSRETVYKLVVSLDGDVDPNLAKALQQTRKNFDEINIGGASLSKTFLQMGQQADLSFGSVLNGVNMVQSGAVSMGTAFGSLGIGLAMKGVEVAIEGVKWALRETVDVIVEGVDRAAEFETIMMNVAKVTPGLRAEGGGYTALYGQYRDDIRAMGVQYATLGNAGIGDILSQGARGGIGQGLSEEEMRQALRAYTEQTAMQSIAWEVDPGAAGAITRDWRAKLGMSQDEVARVADLINYLENTDNADAGPMAQFVTETGSLATGLGIPVDQLAMMATLWGVGGATGDPSKLATAASSMFSRMASGGGQQKGMFGEGAALIGYADPKELSRAFGEDAFGTLVDTLEKIGGLETADAQVAATRGLFGQAAVDEIWVLLNNLDKIGPMLEDLKAGNYLGSVAEEYSYIEGTFENKKAQLEQVWDNLLIDIGTPFMEGLKEVWDDHGTEIIANIPEVASKFAELASEVFRDGGLADQAIALLPKVIVVVEWFLDRLVDWAENPVANMLGLIPGLGKGFTAINDIWNFATGQEVRNDDSLATRLARDAIGLQGPQTSSIETKGRTTLAGPFPLDAPDFIPRNINQTNAPQFHTNVMVNGAMTQEQAQTVGGQIGASAHDSWVESQNQWSLDNQRFNLGPVATPFSPVG